MRRMNFGLNLLIACIFILALGSGSKAQERAGGIVVQELTASETFVEPQALIGPQVPLDESFRLRVKGDYIAAGVGMRNLGEGTININLPVGSTIVRSFLYWAIVRELGRPARNRGRLNGNRVSGTLVGTSGTPCWGTIGEDLIDVYRADVSTIVVDGANFLSDFPSGLTDNTAPQDAPTAFPLLEGASLVVIFGNALFDFNTVVIRDGAQTMVFESVATSFGNFTPVSGVVAGDEVAKTTYIVADGQARFQADQASFDSTVVAGPTTGLKSADAFDGADGIVPVFSLDGLWDTLSVDVSSFFTPDVERSAGARVVASDVGGDCLTWVAQVFSVKVTPPGFDFPIGNPEATGYLVTFGALDFEDETTCMDGRFVAIHPGQDMNSKFGGASDRDDPIFAVADGTIEYADYKKKGTGNVTLIRHDAPEGTSFVLPIGGPIDTVWSQSAHMATISLNPKTQEPWDKGDYIMRGQQIGTVGDGLAGDNTNFHLHFEMRKMGPPKLGPLAFPCKKDKDNPDDVVWLEERYSHPTEFIEANRATNPSELGFWHVLDQQRSPSKVYPQDQVDIFILNPEIDPDLITLPAGDDGMVPHSPCGLIVTCITPSEAIWWYGVNNHTHGPLGVFHGTFIDWVFDETIQTLKNGGLSTVPNTGRLTFQFDLRKLEEPLFQFATWWEIESVDADQFDVMQVLLIDANGIEHHLMTLNPTIDVDGPPDVPYTSAGFNISPEWVDHSIDISAYAGQTVQLVFSFDTRDESYNGFRGWLIDRPAVYSSSDPEVGLFAIWATQQPEGFPDLSRPRDQFVPEP